MGKSSDLCHIEMGEAEYDGECPRDIGIGGGDYINIDYCLECGKIQGNFPIEDPQFHEDFINTEIDEEWIMGKAWKDMSTEEKDAERARKEKKAPVR